MADKGIGNLIGGLKTSFLASVTKTIPANRSIIVNAQGSFFLCKESDDKFQMQMDNNARFDMEAGLSFRLEDGDNFKRLTFFNDTATDNEITFYFGVAEVKDSRFNNIIARQVVLTGAAASSRAVATNVPAGQTVVIPGINAGKRRKQISVYNEDSDTTVNIRTSEGDLFGKCYAFSSWTHETDAVLRVENPSATDCTVGELYYNF